MRRLRRFMTAFALAALASIGAAAAQDAPKPQPYKPIPVQPPKPYADPSFEAFRNQLVAITKRKDRAALAKLIAKNFFWIVAEKDVTDRARSGIDNIVRALDLDSPDSEGWDVLGAFASDPTADPDSQRKGVICSPGDPQFDSAAADELGKLTGTNSASWYYPAAPGLEVRSGPSKDSPVVGKLGMHLIWVYPDDSPIAAVQTDIVRIVMPSGQFGFVAVDGLIPLPGDLLCYVKEGNEWRIAGIVGGELPPK